MSNYHYNQGEILAGKRVEMVFVVAKHESNVDMLEKRVEILSDNTNSFIAKLFINNFMVIILKILFPCCLEHFRIKTMKTSKNVYDIPDQDYPIP